MRVLVGCEFSGVVREAFRNHWHEAWSCDVLPYQPSPDYDYGDDPVPHIQGDIFELLLTSRWDLIILHPPCTYVCVSGNKHYAGSEERDQSIKWTLALWDLAKQKAPRVCLENPVGVLSTLGGMGRPQYIQPWQFGHGEVKKTGLWLHNLPPLVPTDVVDGREERIHLMGPSANRGQLRSITYTGIADAMAKQWGIL